MKEENRIEELSKLLVWEQDMQVQEQSRKQVENMQEEQSIWENTIVQVVQEQ
jgi:hypothetical protein